MTQSQPQPSYELHCDRLDEDLLKTVTHLAEEIFGEPGRDLRARLQGRSRWLLQVARVEGRPVAYKLGYSESETRFHSWLGGVLPEFRRRGIGRQLLHQQHRWAASQGFREVIMATRNRFRGMLLLAIQEGFEIYGTRLDSRNEQLILLRRRLPEENPSDPT